MYLCTDGLPIATSPLFRDTIPWRRLSFKTGPENGDDVHRPGVGRLPGEWVPADRSRFRGQQRDSHRLHDSQVRDETVEATQFAGEYDFKEFRFGEVLLNLAEALFERDGTISDANLNGRSTCCVGALACPC